MLEFGRRENEWRPDLRNPGVLKELQPRVAAYYNIIQYGRHIGIRISDSGTSYWVARIRLKSGAYRHKRLGIATWFGEQNLPFDKALELAQLWFAAEETKGLASISRPIGSNRSLSVCPIGREYTIGHCLQRYLEWKRMAATKSHFETLVSLINFHIVPRLSSVLASDFGPDEFLAFSRDVLETSPKKSQIDLPKKQPLHLLDQESLRRRKKTLNALISILRGALQLAWEAGDLSSDFPLRCLKRLPNIDRPRVVFLTRKECQALIGACHEDLGSLVSAALFTGCRANELIALRVADFDLQLRAVFVTHAKGHRSRYVFLPNEGFEYFKRLTMDRLPEERIFVRSGGRAWGKEYQQHFRQARMNAGLPNSLTFHGLRHTYASQLLSSGASLTSIADQLGHATTDTISKTYGHLTLAQRRFEVDSHFTPLLDAGAKDSSQYAESEMEQVTEEIMFCHRPESSWPRSNFSGYSGGLLPHIRPKHH